MPLWYISHVVNNLQREKKQKFDIRSPFRKYQLEKFTKLPVANWTLLENFQN